MKKFIYILLALPFIACEKTIDYNGDLSEPMIVLGPSNAVSSGFGLSRFEDSVQFILSNSIDILDIGIPGPIQNADVQIREVGGAWIPVIERASGYYSTNALQIVTGKSYEVKASATGYDDVSAKCTVPFPIAINSFKYESTVYPPDTFNFYDAYKVYNLKLQDPGNGRRYFCITAEYRYNDTTLGSTGYEVQLTSKSPYARPITDGDYYYRLNELFGTNEGFEGKEVNIPLQLYNEGWEPNPGDDISLYITVKTLDESGYKYHTSRQRYQQFGGSGDLFSQPVQVFTNVKGGLGFLGGYSLRDKRED
ncbi:DUF4249 domain-containing protein [Phaeocystidibacter marisrubri]|uniref:DUF4249 domain-containing protein n=1 Tax=Phaeocystidibacter marisrubri TaxID=1577780 RepID=A0A6L3ZCI6_9FLAO|nr:DUF4249 domain-containing protein [Phaeocystidibacter marisrubri]KAB2815573.1 DUF4249 domain-containing protein [Phaeocystidibacter marisrubri]GGH64606.1 hypothetical protein GCM10011318_00780 [Phaeocystidibacter marisrubri]